MKIMKKRKTGNTPCKVKITEDASAVEFDFKGKVKDNYVTIDRQPCFKAGRLSDDQINDSSFAGPNLPK